MKKSDLKSGMLVETRDGSLAIVMLNTPKGDALVSNHEEIEEEKTWKSLKEHNNDLTSSFDEDDDIVKVYNFDSNSNGASLSKNCREIIWEREENVPEYTMEEAIKKMGHNFKIIK